MRCKDNANFLINLRKTIFFSNYSTNLMKKVIDCSLWRVRMKVRWEVS